MLKESWESIIKWWYLTIQQDDAQGQGLVEYALILLLVAIAVIVIVSVFGNAVGNLYSVAIRSI